MSRLTAQGRGARSEILEAPKRHEGRAIADAAATMGADLIVMGASVTASVITMLPTSSLWPVAAPRPTLATNASSGLELPADVASVPGASVSTLSASGRVGWARRAGGRPGRSRGVLHRRVGACQTGPPAAETPPP